jgi:hypothetical protein
MTISNSVSSSNTPKFDDVVGVILSEELQRKKTGETSSNALTMENRGRQRERGKILGNRGNSMKGRSKSRVGKIECWNCGKKDCRAPKKQRDGQHEKNQEANLVGDVLQNSFIPYLDNITESWVVYPRASFYATPHRKYFQNYVQGDFGQVYLGDDEPCQIVGLGKVQINQNNGNQWLLKEVIKISDLRRNLIST